MMGGFLVNVGFFVNVYDFVKIMQFYFNGGIYGG